MRSRLYKLQPVIKKAQMLALPLLWKAATRSRTSSFLGLHSKPAFSSAQPPPRVAIVYGTFGKQRESELDATLLWQAAPPWLDVQAPVPGARFDFDSLLETDFLVVATSSWLARRLEKRRSLTI